MRDFVFYDTERGRSSLSRVIRHSSWARKKNHPKSGGMNSWYGQIQKMFYNINLVRKLLSSGYYKMRGVGDADYRNSTQKLSTF